MSKHAITLYVNEPMGRRWLQNLEAARAAAEELNADVIIVEKSSERYMQEQTPPPCPSVMLDEDFLIRDGTITYQEIRSSLERSV